MTATQSYDRWYGQPLPGFESTQLPGKLIVIEGGDGAGRSTQVSALKRFLHHEGFPVKESGLKRSTLLGDTLQQVMKQNSICPRTLSLFYATDFAEQLERTILPALHAGFHVIADRYIYSLVVRACIRGVPEKWLLNIYQVAIKPDLIIYLDVAPEILAERTLIKKSELDYWESGLDMGRRGDLYQSFVAYQKRVAEEFAALGNRYPFRSVDGSRAAREVADDIRRYSQEIF